MIGYDTGTSTEADENYGISGGFSTIYVGTGAASGDQGIYICPNDLYIVGKTEPSDHHNKKNISIYQLDIDMPWIFDFDEPWKSPIHYQRHQKKITAKSAVVKKSFTTIKQPISKSGFKKGQRK